MNSFVKLLKIIILSESCPKNCVGKIVQQFTSKGPMNFFQRVTQQIHLGGLSNVFISEGCPQLKQIFLFGNDFHTWHKHV